ncbi:MAG: hypothetical protein K1X75_11940 [Leptospirales bacterium]|nr:hypothetical protein [Leptospirales bacterium]
MKCWKDRICRGAAILLGSLLWLGCNGSAVVLADDGMSDLKISERLVHPTAADQGVSNWDLPHLVLRAEDRPQIGALLLFFPGTLAAPDDYRNLLSEAAARGYHVISLSYPNELRLSAGCNAGSDPDCHGRAREEILFGRDVSPLIEVRQPDSILQRTQALLHYLAAQDPEAGWSEFLDDEGAVDWRRVAVSGYSQGAGHAAYLAKHFRVMRVGMYSGPADVTVSGRPASWLSMPSATPPELYAGFTHKRDEVLYYWSVLRNWRKLGLSDDGPAVDVDHSAFPFSGRRQLFSDRDPGNERAYVFHGATVRDSDTPRDERGAPLYRGIWRYVSLPH